MARKRKSTEPIGIGMTAKQLKRKKPINNDFLVDIEPLTDNQTKLFDAYKEHNIYSFYRNSSYIMNHQFGIWKRSALIENLQHGESPWTNELRATKRISAKREHDRYYCFDYAWYEMVVRRGKFTKDGENMLKGI